MCRSRLAPSAVALACVAVAIPGMPVEAALAVHDAWSLGARAVERLDGKDASSETSGALQAAAIAAFAPLYIGVPLGLLAATRWTLGSEAALLLILTVAISDTFQYYSGRTVRSPIAGAGREPEENRSKGRSADSSARR